MIEQKPLGGSELMYYTMTSMLPPDWTEKFNLVLSACDPKFLDPTKINIVWQQLNTNEESVALMADPTYVSKVQYWVWVSNWNYEQFRKKFNVPSHNSIVIKNATHPVEFKTRERQGKIKLIYTSTPWRGLDVLLDSIDMLGRTDIELDIFSSTKIYGPGFEKLMQGKFDQLWERCRNTPGVTLHGYATNDVVRDYLTKAHIFAYPNTFEETSCISAIEALTAGCKVVTSGHGALPETCGDWATYIPYGVDRDVMAQRFAVALNDTINNYWSEETQGLLIDQSRHYNKHYTWEKRLQEWQHFFSLI
jgi:glycosyltransferase involved in cell wall biosynthesis